MSGQPDLQSLMTSLSTKANELVLEISWLRAQNTGLRNENTDIRNENTGLRDEITMLGKQQSELLKRVFALESQVHQHETTEKELVQSIHRISDTLTSVTSQAKAPAENTITFGPSNGQITYFNSGNVGKQLSSGAFASSRAAHPASPGGKTNVPPSVFTAPTFAGKTESTFGGKTGSTFGGKTESTFGGKTEPTFGGKTESTFGGKTEPTFGVEPTFATKTESASPSLFGSPFGALKIGNEKTDGDSFKSTQTQQERDPFKTTDQKTPFGHSTTATQQKVSFSSEQSVAQNVSESTSATNKRSLFSSTSIFGKTSSEKGASQKTSESTWPNNKPGPFSSSFDQAGSNLFAQTTSNPEGQKGWTTTTDSSFQASTNVNAFGVKPQPPAQTKDSNKLFASFGEKPQETTAGAVKTASDPLQTNGSYPSNREEACKTHSTHKGEASEDQKWRDYSELFPSPTPLSRSTFGAASTSERQEPHRKQPNFGPEKMPSSLLIPPPRSTSFSYQLPNVDGEKYATISLMPFFERYSAEEVRLWDYVNKENLTTF